MAIVGGGLAGGLTREYYSNPWAHGAAAAGLALLLYVFLRAAYLWIDVAGNSEAVYGPRFFELISTALVFIMASPIVLAVGAVFRLRSSTTPASDRYASTPVKPL